MSVEDKQPYINHARDIYELLTRLPHDVEERAHDLALHHARQIVSFYEHFDLSDADALVYRDACAAENLKWWHERSGDRIASGRRPPHCQRPGTAQRHSACPGHELSERRLLPPQLVWRAVPVDRLAFDHGDVAVSQLRWSAPTPP